jgi:hypothetical protein
MNMAESQNCLATFSEGLTFQIKNENLSNCAMLGHRQTDRQRDAQAVMTLTQGILFYLVKNA